MENMQSKQLKVKPQSGISRLKVVPAILKYPQFLPFKSTPSINNIFCYVIEHYGYSGLSVLIYRQPENDQVTVMCGDWQGNNLDIQTNKPTALIDVANIFIKNDLTKFINLMHSINQPQAQFFFALDDDGLMLVDMQIAQDKLVGPGMIRDIFGKIYRTQIIRKVEIIDERAIKYLEQKTGSYSGNIILKPSKFKMYHNEQANTYQPLYVEVV